MTENDERPPSTEHALQQWRAAKSALAAMALAETSAEKTARAAKAAVLSAQGDVADRDAETSMAEIDEVAAHQRYRDASTAAANRNEGDNSGR